MHEAKWYLNINDYIKCILCSHYCIIKDDKSGVCKVRKKIGNKLYTFVYGTELSMAIDPIEKKPLYHFYPKSEILSFGTPGCNFHCDFCQNYSLSQSTVTNSHKIEITPQNIIDLVNQYKVKFIAYTYNEPTIFGEYLYDVSMLAWTNGIKNVIVSNGYFAKETREELLQFVDAANIDLKSISKKFYSKIVGGKLNSVLENLIWLKTKTKIWLEITYLIIPNYNDSIEEFKNYAKWIKDNIGIDTPIHLNAFHPDYKICDTEPTSVKTLLLAKDYFQKEGIKYIYLGNKYIENSQNTYCHNCGELLIKREGYNTKKFITSNNCPNCNSVIPGHF